MNSHRAKIFFYGSYINFDVLAEAGIGDRSYRIARLPGFRLVISPLANLVADASSESWGILTSLTHAELEGLYVGHAQKKLGGVYLPEAVIVYDADEEPVPALCYIAHDMQPSAPDPAYVDRILKPATNYGFPPDYLAHIASLK